MEPINGLSSIMEILRRQISDNAKRLDQIGKTRIHGSAAKASKSEITSPKELRALIQERIKGLNPQEPHYQQKAKRLFLESVMRWEFGNEISHDQEFNDLLTEIQQLIELSPEVKRQFDTLIEQFGARAT